MIDWLILYSFCYIFGRAIDFVRKRVRCLLFCWVWWIVFIERPKFKIALDRKRQRTHSRSSTIIKRGKSVSKLDATDWYLQKTYHQELHPKKNPFLPFSTMILLRTVFDQCIKGELNGNPGVKDYNLAARSYDTEAIVWIEEGTNSLSSCFSNHLRFVCQLQTRPHRKIVGPRQCIVVVLLLLLLMMKIHRVWIKVCICGWLWNWVRDFRFKRRGCFVSKDSSDYENTKPSVLRIAKQSALNLAARAEVYQSRVYSMLSLRLFRVRRSFYFVVKALNERCYLWCRCGYCEMIISRCCLRTIGKLSFGWPIDSLYW